MSMGMIGLFLGILAPFLGPVVLFVGLGLTLGGVGLGVLADKLEFKPYNIAEKTITKYEKLEEEEKDLEKEMEKSASKFIDGEEKLDSLEIENQGLAQEIMQFEDHAGDRYHPLPDFIEQVNTFAPISHPKDENGNVIVSNIDYLDKENLQYRQALIAELKRINLMPEDEAIRTRGLGKNKETLPTNKELKQQAIESFKQQFYITDMSQDDRKKVSDTIEGLFAKPQLLAEFVDTAEKYNSAQESENTLLQSQRKEIAGMDNKMLDKIYNNSRSNAQRRAKLDERHATAIIRARAINNKLNTQENQELLNLVPEEERETHAQYFANASQQLENEVNEIKEIAKDNVERIANVEMLPKYIESIQEDNANYATKLQAQEATLDYLYTYTQNYYADDEITSFFQDLRQTNYVTPSKTVLGPKTYDAFDKIRESGNLILDDLLNVEETSKIKNQIFNFIDDKYADKILEIYQSDLASTLLPSAYDKSDKNKNFILENVALSLAKADIVSMLTNIASQTNDKIKVDDKEYSIDDIIKMDIKSIKSTFNIYSKIIDGKDVIVVNDQEYSNNVTDVKNALDYLALNNQFEQAYISKVEKIPFDTIIDQLKQLNTYPSTTDIDYFNKMILDAPFLTSLNDDLKDKLINISYGLDTLKAKYDYLIKNRDELKNDNVLMPQIQQTINNARKIIRSVIYEYSHDLVEQTSTIKSLKDRGRHKNKIDMMASRHKMYSTIEKYEHVDEVFGFFVDKNINIDKFRDQYNSLLDEYTKDGKTVSAGEIVKQTLSTLIGDTNSINGQTFDEIVDTLKDENGIVDFDKLSNFAQSVFDAIDMQSQYKLKSRVQNHDENFVNDEFRAQRKAFFDPKQPSAENMMQVVIESGLADMDDIVSAFTNPDLEKGLKDLLKKCGLSSDQVDSVINAKFLNTKTPYKMFNSAQRRYINLKNSLAKLRELEEKYNDVINELTTTGNLEAFKKLDVKECAKYGIKIDRILSAIEKHKKDGTEIKLDDAKIAKDIENNLTSFRLEKNALAFNIENQNKILNSTTERDARFEQAKLDLDVYEQHAEAYSGRLEQIAKVFQNLAVTPSMAKQFMEAVASGNIQEFATNNSHIQDIADLGNMTQAEIDRYQSLGLSFKEFEKIAKSLKEDKNAKISEKKMKKALQDLAQFNQAQQENINKQKQIKEQKIKKQSKKIKEQEKEDRAESLDHKDKNSFLAKLFNFKNATKEKLKDEKEKTQKREEERAKEEREREEADKRAKETEEKREKGEEGEEASHDAKPEEEETRESNPEDAI